MRWLAPRALAGLLAAALLGAGLWQTAPQVVRKFEIDSAYQQTLQRFALEEQELVREQAALMEALRLRRVTEAAALDKLAEKGRRDALKALAQAFETRQTVWIERSRVLQVQAENILLQMRLRKSMETARP